MTTPEQPPRCSFGVAYCKDDHIEARTLGHLPAQARPAVAPRTEASAIQHALDYVAESVTGAHLVRPMDVETYSRILELIARVKPRNVMRHTGRWDRVRVPEAEAASATPPAVASEGLPNAVAARRSRSAAPDVTCGCGDGGNEDGPFTLCAIHEQRWGPLTRDTLLNIVVDWEAAFAEVEGQLDAALASDAGGSVGALDGWGVPIKLLEQWLYYGSMDGADMAGLEDKTRAYLDEYHRLARPAAVYDAERQGES